MTELLPVETEVRTLLFCSMSMRVEPEGPAVPPLTRPADAPVNVTVPTFAKGTREPPDSKSSTIHSALYSQSAGWPLKVCDTVLPFVLFLIVTEPPVLEVAVTVTVTLSPAEKLMPEKSYA